jgi:hypothetical protein
MALNIVKEEAILLPFSIDGQGNVSKTSDQEKVWADRVFGALGTLTGTRLLRSTYGSEVARSAMETGDSAEAIITAEVERTFSNSFPTLSLVDVSFEFQEDINVIDVEVTYTLPNQTEVSLQVGLAYINDVSPIQEVNL